MTDEKEFTEPEHWVEEIRIPSQERWEAVATLFDLRREINLQALLQTNREETIEMLKEGYRSPHGYTLIRLTIPRIVRKASEDGPAHQYISVHPGNIRIFPWGLVFLMSIMHIETALGAVIAVFKLLNLAVYEPGSAENRVICAIHQKFLRGAVMEGNRIISAEDLADCPELEGFGQKAIEDSLDELCNGQWLSKHDDKWVINRQMVLLTSETRRQIIDEE